MTVTWTDAALADLRVVQSYIAQHSSQYAYGMVRQIFARSEQLVSQPRLKSVVPEYQDEALRELLKHPYQIVYRLVDDIQIDIVAVVHSARQMPRGL